MVEERADHVPPDCSCSVRDLLADLRPGGCCSKSGHSWSIPGTGLGDSLLLLLLLPPSGSRDVRPADLPHLPPHLSVLGAGRALHLAAVHVAGVGRRISRTSGSCRAGTVSSGAGDRFVPGASPRVGGDPLAGGDCVGVVAVPGVVVGIPLCGTALTVPDPAMVMPVVAGPLYAGPGVPLLVAGVVLGVGVGALVPHHHMRPGPGLPGQVGPLALPRVGQGLGLELQVEAGVLRRYGAHHRAAAGGNNLEAGWVFSPAVKCSVSSLIWGVVEQYTF